MMKNFSGRILIPGNFRAARMLSVIAVSMTVAGIGTLPHQPDLLAACHAPIRLRVGAIDPRFGVSPEELQLAIGQAADLWARAAHRPLFEYDPGAELAVNLVYDERQEATNKYLQAQENIRELTDKAVAALSELKPMQALLNEAEQSYASQKASFNRVREIETIAGAHNAIQGQTASLQNKKQELDRLNAEVNARIEQYDSLIEASNARLKALTDSGAAGIELIAGHYAEEDGTRRIDLFQFKDRRDLLLLLTHELGHAMGVEHNLNPRSIMAPLIATREMALSLDDLAGLSSAAGPEICGRGTSSK